jgi:hypothetical protein
LFSAAHTRVSELQVAENLRVVTLPAKHGKPRSEAIFAVE